MPLRGGVSKCSVPMWRWVFSSTAFFFFTVALNTVLLQVSVLAALLGSVVSFSLPLASIRSGIMALKAKVQASPPQKRNICVVGGGFGGLYSALSISKHLDCNTDLYIVDPKDSFVFLPLLYELAVGYASELEVAPKFSSLLSSRVKFIRGKVDNIDFSKQTCTIKASEGDLNSKSLPTNESGDSILHYDQLILAVGNQPRISLIPGAKEHALPFYRLEDGLVLRSRLKSLKDLCAKTLVRVVVIGAGFSGVELAASVADFFPNGRASVHLLDRNDRILPAAADFNRRVSQRSLMEQGVKISFNTTVKEITARGVFLIDDRGSEYYLDADLVLCTAGSEQTPLVKKLPLLKSRFGRILTRRSLQTIQHDRVFCLGDCGVMEGKELPGTAQVALQQARTVAVNVLRQHRQSIRGLELFRFINIGEMLTLGQINASMTALSGWFRLSGPLAAVGRRSVYALRMPTILQSMIALSTGPFVMIRQRLLDILRLLFHTHATTSTSSLKKE